LLEDKDISVNVISKSGTTTEPAIAFRIFREYLEKKYGVSEARKRIYATTDKSRGALKTLADSEGYQSFVIPDDVGGRFSVLTAVGLLPIAAAGINIDDMMLGAADGFKSTAARRLSYNFHFKQHKHHDRSGRTVCKRHEAGIFACKPVHHVEPRGAGGSRQ
jgi:glucose-6-phosphate isomerase